jgi:hypothetical protein
MSDRVIYLAISFFLAVIVVCFTLNTMITS